MEKSVIVLDIGSHSIKVGLASSEKPDFIIPSVFPLNSHSFPITENIPEEAELDDLAFEGEIVNNDRMTFLLVSIFDKYFPDSQPVPQQLGFVFTNTPEASVSHLEFLAEQAFGVFGASKILVKSQSLFSLLPYKFNTCSSIDIGHDVTQVCAFCDGVVKNVIRSSLAGSALDLFTARVIMGLEDFVTYKEYKEVQKTKQEKAKVPETKDFDRSDKTLLCGEVLFEPELMLQSALGEDDKDVENLSKQPSISNLIKDSIDKCDSKYSNDLWTHIIVTGGTSLLNGLKERLTNELKLINKDANLIFPETPIISAWKGAAYAANNEQQDHWLYVDDFDKDPSIVFSKF